MADKHWTVTIQVHEVTAPEPIRDGNSYAVKVPAGPGKSTVVMTERQVLERFATTVRANSEEEAYRKAMALLEVNRPQSEAMRRPGSETLTIPPRPMHTGD